MVDFRTGKLISPATETESGIPVTAEGAFAFHAWYRAVSLIAQKCAAVPKHLYRTTKLASGQKGRERAESHPVYRLVRGKANAEQTAFQFWLQMAGHTASRGNAYAYLWRPAGEIEELIPVDPDRTHPVRRDGELWYVVFPFGEQGDGRKLRASEVLHFRGFGFDGLSGYPVWEVAAQEVGLARANRKLAATRFTNSGRPSMILQADRKLPKETKRRILSEWEGMHVGLDNAGKTAILDDGLKAQPISMSAEELDQSGASQMSLVAISNYTGVPVTKLGGQKAYTSPEQEDRAFINDGLDFYLNLFDDESTDKLLTEDERNVGGYEVKSNREALLRPDTKTKFDVLRSAVAGKPILTQNEAREQIDMPPSEEDGADELGTPLNMGQGGADNQPDNVADTPPGRPPDGTTPLPDAQPGENVEDGTQEDTNAAARSAVAAVAAREAARFALAHAAARMVKRAGLAACAAAEGGSSSFVKFLASFTKDNRQVFKSEFASAERIARAVSADDNPKPGDVAEWCLAAVAAGYEKLCDSATEKTIAAKAIAEYARQLLAFPQDAASVFVESEPKPQVPKPEPKTEGGKS